MHTLAAAAASATAELLSADCCLLHTFRFNMLSEMQLAAAQDAARDGDAAGVVAALAPGAPADRALVNALGAACDSGLDSCVTVLLRARADPNCQVPENEWQSAPPLHAAASSYHSTGTECMALLLAGGADPLAVDSLGRTALHCAHSAARARMLFQAAPQAALVRDRSGHTPLQAAIGSISEFGTARCLAAEAPLQPVQEVLDSLRQALERLRSLEAAADASGRQCWHEYQQRSVALVPLLEARLGLDLSSWYEDPSLCPNPWLAPALPAALECSEAAAGWLVRCLPPTDRQRLRTAALSLGRAGREASAALPGPIVGRVLALGMAELPPALARQEEPCWFHLPRFKLMRRITWLNAFAALIMNGSWLRATWSLYQDRVQLQQTHGAWLYVALMLSLWVQVSMLVLLFLDIRAIWLL